MEVRDDGWFMYICSFSLSLSMIYDTLGDSDFFVWLAFMVVKESITFRNWKIYFTISILHAQN